MDAYLRIFGAKMKIDTLQERDLLCDYVRPRLLYIGPDLPLEVVVAGLNIKSHCCEQARSGRLHPLQTARCLFHRW